MNIDKTNGVIIKQSDFGEGHRMLWVFTDRYGIIKAVSHGAGRVKSKNSAATQFLSYCEFCFYTGGEIRNISSVSAVDTFWPIQEDIKKLALCTYFADLVYYSLEMGNPDRNILRLFLNTLYACAYKSVGFDVLKLTFELKLMYMSGFLPVPSVCSRCGGDGVKFVNVKTGAMLCANCFSKDSVPVSGDAYKALCYITCCDMKKMFSVCLPPDSVKELAPIAEKLAESVLDMHLKSLDYYKKF